MSKASKWLLALSISATWVLSLVPAEGATFIAFSMKEAERRAEAGAPSDPELVTLGGITRPVGWVYDAERDDVIIIGEAAPGEKPVSLADLVVAIRAVVGRAEWPEVSIDATPETPKTGQQVVRFVGGIDNTPLGMDLFEADLTLKRLALGLLPTDVWGLRSYFAMRVDQARQSPQDAALRTKFWFFPAVCGRAAREGVLVVRDFRMGVEARLEAVASAEKATGDPSKLRNEVADRFAAALTGCLGDLCKAHSEVGRMEMAVRLVALADGLRRLPRQPDLRYWLNRYPVPHVPTPRQQAVLQRQEKIHAPDGTAWDLTIDGGVQLKVLQSRLSEDGDIMALRDIVLGARPSGRPLWWRLPLGRWRSPGYEADAPDRPSLAGQDTATFRVVPGCTVNERLNSAGTPLALPSVLSTPTRMPGFDTFGRLPAQRYSQDVGGVMMQASASVAGQGAGQAKVDLTDGQFSLIVGGQNARLDPMTYRKFITALWAVYFTAQDPGISIDPIAPGVDKHLVRYIGKVINTDLGRVMREADYLMKKWAVGTERPAIRGFSDVDALWARYGHRYAGLGRRFWFVPEEMRFTRAAEALLFDGGRMTVKTAYDFEDNSGRAGPAEEAFARCFTERYAEIAEKYPVYRELFEYAKMVSLAKYLKQNGVPLFWFLMANRDLVITEDSPGTVDELAKGSRYVSGMTVKGGVNLGTPGRYVYDAEAVRAINQAVARLPARDPAATSLGAGTAPSPPSPAPFSFDLRDRSYTVLPQHSLTSGTDRRGRRYQTDIAFRSPGGPGLQLVRYFDPGESAEGDFGVGWHLLVPYRVRPAGDAKREFRGLMFPERMTVENQLTGEREVLAFSDTRYSIAGYVPDDLTRSQVIGLFPMTDLSWRLADKLGNEFCFDGAGRLTDAILSPEYHLHLEYLDEFTREVDRPPFRVEPADDERQQFLNARIPKRMKVVNLLGGQSETLEFSDRGPIPGYVPADEAKSRWRVMAITVIGAFRLLDRNGRELAFDPAGAFAGVMGGVERPIVKSIAAGTETLTFTYTVDATGAVRIASARAATGQDGAGNCLARYEYDGEGRLCRVNRQPLGPVQPPQETSPRMARR